MLLCEQSSAFQKHQFCSSQLNVTSVVVLINAGIIKGVNKRWRCEGVLLCEVFISFLTTSIMFFSAKCYPCCGVDKRRYHQRCKQALEV